MMQIRAVSLEQPKLRFAMRADTTLDNPEIELTADVPRNFLTCRRGWASNAGEAAMRVSNRTSSSWAVVSCLVISVLGGMLPQTAGAVTITSTFFFRDNQDPVQPTIIPGIGGGDALTIGVRVSNVAEVTSGRAVHSPTSSLVPLSTSLTVFPNDTLVAADIPYDPLKTKGTDWTITVNGVGGPAVSIPTRDLSGIGLMPLVTSLNASGPARNPTISWTLPTSGPTVNSVLVQVYNDDTNVFIGGRTFAASTTSVTLQSVLGNVDLSGAQLAVRVIPTNGGSTLPSVVTRSSNWIVIDTKGANVAGDVAVLETGSPVTLAQSIETPEVPFLVSFAYRFLSPSGDLQVLLDGNQIGSTLFSASQLDDAFGLATFEVDDPTLLGRTGIPLTFVFDGPSGSTLLLDNIDAPGLLNGTFEGQLASWAAGGEGVVAVSAIPEPSAIVLLAGGLGALGALRLVRPPSARRR